MMRFTATRSTAFCAAGARSGGVGSVRVEAIGFRQREQTGARALTSLPQAGQEIDAIPVQSLSRQFPLQGSVSASKTNGGGVAAWTPQKLRGTSHCVGSSQVTDKADKWMSEGGNRVHEAAPSLPSARGHTRCKRVGSFCALPPHHFDDGASHLGTN
jgi:hypothetical protein